VRDTLCFLQKSIHPLDKAVIETFNLPSAQPLRCHVHSAAPLKLISRTDVQFHLSIVGGTNILVA